MDITDREELISAYLDDELDAPQRERVEQLLAEDEGAARLLEEFRALRTSLRALPVATPPDGFSEEVLRQAVRAAGVGGDNSPPAVSLSPSAGEHADGGRDLRRPFLWSALAIAAAILLMLVSNPQPSNDLARDDAASETTGAERSDDVIGAARDRARPEISAAPVDAPDGVSEPKSGTGQRAGAGREALAAGAENRAAEGTAAQDPVADTTLDARDGVTQNSAQLARSQPSTAESGKQLPGGPARGRNGVAAPFAGDAVGQQGAPAVQSKSPAGPGLTVYTYAVMNQIDAQSARHLVNSRLNAATTPLAQAQQAQRRTALLRMANGQAEPDRDLAAATSGIARKSRVRQTGSGFEYVYELAGTQQQIDNSLSQLQSSGVFQLVSVALRPDSIRELSARQSASFGGGGVARAPEALGDGGAAFRRPVDRSDVDRHNKETQSADAADPATRAADAEPSADAGAEAESSVEKVVGSKPKAGKAAGYQTDGVGLPPKANPTRPTEPDDIVDAAPAFAVDAPGTGAEGSKAADKRRGGAERLQVHRVLVVFRVNDPAAASAGQGTVGDAQPAGEKAPGPAVKPQD